MKNRGHNILESDRVGQVLMKLSAPAFFGMFVQSIYNVVDTIFVGRFIGSLALAGLSMSFPIQMMAMGIGNMVGLGGGSLISRLLGRGDKPGAERALGNGLGFGIILSVLLVAGLLPSLDFWLRLVGASEEVLPYAEDYLTVMIGGMAFSILGSVLLSYVRAEGNARVGMTAMILGSVLNIILDAVFIISLHMGVRGAALATVISQAIALIYLVSYYTTKSSYLRIRTSNFTPDFKILKSILAVGISSFVQAITSSLSAMLLIKMVVVYGGDIALSAFGVIQRIMMFSFMPGMVIGQGMQPVLGYNYGARRYHHAIKAITLATIASVACSILAFAVLYFFPQPVVELFTKDQRLIAETTYAAKRIFVALPLLGVFNVGQLVFPSVGKAVESFIVAISRPVLFLIPAVLILPRIWQMDGVWLSFPASDVMTFLLIVGLMIPLIRGFKKAAAAVEKEKSEARPV